MRYLADMVVAQMEGAPAPPSLAEMPPFVRTCFRPHCAGCELDDEDARHWSIACGGCLYGFVNYGGFRFSA